jgi:hypothetical protein
MGSVIPPTPLDFPAAKWRALRRCFVAQDSVLVSIVRGVGHPEYALAPVRGSNARSAQICGPAGISQCFQISANSGEPFASILARNLLSKDDWRRALSDKAVKSGPEMSLIGMALPLSSARKRLTGTGARPHWAFIRPASDPRGEAPPTDAREEVALRISGEVSGLDIQDAPFVHIARGDVPLRDQVVQPRHRVRVKLVVVGGHAALVTNMRLTI